MFGELFFIGWIALGAVAACILAVLLKRGAVRRLRYWRVRRVLDADVRRWSRVQTTGPALARRARTRRKHRFTDILSRLGGVGAWR